MTRKGSFTAVMAGFAALLAAAAVVQAAPKPKTDEATAAKARTGAEKKAPSKKAAEKKPAKKAAKDSPAKKNAAKPGAKSASKSAAKAPVPLPKRRPAESATAAGAFPTPIGTAPILPSGLVPAVTASAPALVAPQREAALTPPTSRFPSALVPAAPISADTLAAVKKAVELTRRRRNSEAREDA